MEPASRRGQGALKACHVVFAAAWLLAAVTLLLVLLLVRTEDARRLLGIHQATKLIDDFILIPSAAGTCLTALLLSVQRRWRAQRWVTANWVIVVAAVLFGVFWLGPSLDTLPRVAGQLGMGALADPGYTRARAFLLVGAPLQVGSLFVVICLCVRKPGGPRGNNRAKPRG